MNAIDAKCTIDPNCESRRAVAHSPEAGEFACIDHLPEFIAGELAEGRAVDSETPEYTGPKLVSLTGSKVHYPAIIGQQDTHRTGCAPHGRMGARQMRLRFTSEKKWAVDCKTCLKVGPPKPAA